MSDSQKETVEILKDIRGLLYDIRNFHAYKFYNGYGVGDHYSCPYIEDTCVKMLNAMEFARGMYHHEGMQIPLVIKHIDYALRSQMKKNPAYSPIYDGFITEDELE